jgi:DnaJ-class molecular chaperone
MSTLTEDYKLLNIAINSDISEIKKAYKKLALKKHPDRGGNPEDFQNLQNAYDRLIKYKENSQKNHSFNSIPMNSTAMNDLFNEDVFTFAFNRGFPSDFLNQNTVNTTTFRPTSRRVKIKTQIINGERKTTVEEYYN